MNNDALKMMTLEMQIYNLISNCCENDEIIECHPLFNFSLPNGLKKLGWPLKTVIDIKKRLIYDSLYRLRENYDNYSPQKIIVIVEDDFFYYRPKTDINGIPGRNIEIKSFLKLRNELIHKLGSKDFKRYDKDKNLVFDDLKEKLTINSFSLFLGAGVSMDAAVPSWAQLLDSLICKNNLLIPCYKTDLIVKARYIVNNYYQNVKEELEKEIEKEENEKMKEILQRYFDYEVKHKSMELIKKDMNDILYQNAKSSLLIDAIADLIVFYNGKIESIITYNYDNLLEQKLDDLNNNPDFKNKYKNSKAKELKTLSIKHVHGLIVENTKSVLNSSEIVFGEKEYHKLYDESNNWGNVDQLHALNNSICIFIGLSMTDPNLRRLLDMASKVSDNGSHYVFLKKECDVYVKFMEKDMESLGVKCIWYNQYKELPKLLKELF